MANSKDKILLNFKEKDGKVYFIGKYMEVYIPYNYFESNMANIIEDRIETLGIFLIRIYSSEDKKESSETHVYKFPSLLTTRPSNYIKQKFTVNKEVNDYLTLQYYTNDIFIDSTILVESSAFANQYITYYHNGKIPNFVNYDDTLLMELETTFLNKLDFPISAVNLEAINSEINRDINDISKPFRFAASEGAGKNDYKPISMKQLPAFNSTFTGITFEDIDYQMVSSVNKTRYNKKEKISPLEETIKY